MHPAFGFASVMLGAALFEVAGALLAIPVGAMLIAFLEARRTRYEVLEAPVPVPAPASQQPPASPDQTA